MINKIFYSLIIISSILSSFIFMPIAQAEIEIYEGHGDYLKTDETIEYAKEQAKIEAERDISHQVYTYIKSHSQNKDSTLDYDEVFGETESIIRIIEVKYNLIPEKENIIIRATIKAEIDTDELEKIYNQK